MDGANGTERLWESILADPDIYGYRQTAESLIRRREQEAMQRERAEFERERREEEEMEIREYLAAEEERMQRHRAEWQRAREANEAERLERIMQEHREREEVRRRQQEADWQRGIAANRQLGLRKNMRLLPTPARAPSTLIVESAEDEYWTPFQPRAYRPFPMSDPRTRGFGEESG
jgi:hypothetical protein